MTGRCPHCEETLSLSADASYCPKCRAAIDESRTNGKTVAKDHVSSSNSLNDVNKMTYLKLIRSHERTIHVPKQTINKSTPQVTMGGTTYHELPLFVPGQDDSWLRYNPGTI